MCSCMQRQSGKAATCDLYDVCKQIGEREDCPETAVDIAPKRDTLLQQLLTLLNTDNLPQPQAPLADDDTAPLVVS